MRFMHWLPHLTVPSSGLAHPALEAMLESRQDPMTFNTEANPDYARGD